MNDNTEPKHELNLSFQKNITTLKKKGLIDLCTSYRRQLDEWKTKFDYANNAAESIMRQSDKLIVERASLRSEVAELRKENELKKAELLMYQGDLLLGPEVKAQAETIKRLTEALEHLLTGFKKTNVFHQNQGYINFIESALSGTKETE